jgi:hypothetical protein
MFQTFVRAAALMAATLVTVVSAIAQEARPNHASMNLKRSMKYPSRVRIYADARLTNREVFYEPVLDITADRLSGAVAVNDATATVVVRFKNDEGKDDGVAFRDGGRIGLRGETGPIYQALRRAAKK